MTTTDFTGEFAVILTNLRGLNIMMFDASSSGCHSDESQNVFHASTVVLADCIGQIEKIEQGLYGEGGAS